MIEVSFILRNLKIKLTERRNKIFLPAIIKNILPKLEGEKPEITSNFIKSAVSFSSTCIEYLEQWTGQFEDIKVFMWTLLKSLY